MLFDFFKKKKDSNNEVVPSRESEKNYKLLVDVNAREVSEGDTFGVVDFNGKNFITFKVDLFGNVVDIKVPTILFKKLPKRKGGLKFYLLDRVSSVYSGNSRIVKVVGNLKFETLFYIVPGDGEFYWACDFYDVDGNLLGWSLDNGFVVEDKIKGARYTEEEKRLTLGWYGLNLHQDLLSWCFYYFFFFYVEFCEAKFHLFHFF